MHNRQQFVHPLSSPIPAGVSCMEEERHRSEGSRRRAQQRWHSPLVLVAELERGLGQQGPLVVNQQIALLR
jgi:hypothetical protein